MNTRMNALLLVALSAVSLSAHAGNPFLSPKNANGIPSAVFDGTTGIAPSISGTKKMGATKFVLLDGEWVKQGSKKGNITVSHVDDCSVTISVDGKQTKIKLEGFESCKKSITSG